MGGGTGPRNVLFTTGQECKVSFSKVLRCVSGPNTVVTDVAWVAGRVPGRGPLLLWSTPGLLSVPCHCGPWCPGSCSTPDPVFPPMLGGILGSAGASGVQEKAGMLPGPEPALGQSWNVGVPTVTRGTTPRTAAASRGWTDGPRPPWGLMHRATAHWTWGACEAPSALAANSDRPGHTGPFQALLPLLCVTSVFAHPLEMPAGGHLTGKRTLHPGLGPSGMRQPWWKPWAWLPRH